MMEPIQIPPMAFTCASCGKEITGIVYSDGGMMEVVHGGGKCEECYGKTHPRCSCGSFLSERWLFCPWCGKRK